MTDITQLLRRWRTGDRDAENELFVVVLPRLRRLARYLLNGERRDHSMQPTELVDEIYLRLVGAKEQDWQNRAHFFAIAGRSMRRYLVDHARKRGGVNFVELDNVRDFLAADTVKMDLVITVDRLLDDLEKVNPEACRLVEVKYFLGLTDEEAAAALGLKLRTMQRMWLEARKWLFAEKEASSAKPIAG